jgi:hypothetical protein
VTRPRTTIGKRNVQQMKREKAQAKQERKAARRAVPEAGPAPVMASEAELIEELAGLSRSLESGQLSPREFEDRRERIRTQLEQIGGMR